MISAIPKTGKGPAAVIFRTDSQLEEDSVALVGDEFRELSDPSYAWYQKVREYRKDPTLSLGAGILAAPLLSADWIIEGRDEAACELLRKVFLPIKDEIFRHTVMSGMYYGWQSWETRPWKIQGEGLTRYLKTKPLRHEYTTLLTDKNGFLSGLFNNTALSQSSRLSVPRVEGEPIAAIGQATLEFPYCAVHAANDEYNNPLGYPLMKNVEGVMDSYATVEAGAARYVERTAGSHWVLWYPDGIETTVGGQTVPSDVVAQKVLDSLRASGTVALPVSAAELNAMITGSGGSDIKKSGWDLKLITSEGGGDPFLERQSYLDALKLRALMIPERTALEGHFGTKAESSEHADIAMMAIDGWGQSMMKWINSEYGIIAQILRMNKIPYYPGRAKASMVPLMDDVKTFFREIFRTVVNNAPGFARIVDVEDIAQKTSIPIDKEELEHMKKQAREMDEVSLKTAKAGAKNAAAGIVAGQTGSAGAGAGGGNGKTSVKGKPNNGRKPKSPGNGPGTKDSRNNK